MTLHASAKGPLVTLECVDVLTEDDLTPLFKAFDAARRAGPFAVITDTRRMTSAPPAVLSAFSARLKQMPPLRNIWLGDAVVVNSAAVRFILSTLLMVAPMPTEVKAFDDLPEARRWCATILRRAGVSVPLEVSTPA
jgi:hypothetical protein